MACTSNTDSKKKKTTKLITQNEGPFVSRPRSSKKPAMICQQHLLNMYNNLWDQMTA